MKPVAVLIVLVVTAVSLAACATWDPQVRALAREPHLREWVDACNAGDMVACRRVHERVLGHPVTACARQPDGQVACY